MRKRKTRRRAMVAIYNIFAHAHPSISNPPWHDDQGDRVETMKVGYLDEVPRKHVEKTSVGIGAEWHESLHARKEQPIAAGPSGPGPCFARIITTIRFCRW